MYEMFVCRLAAMKNKDLTRKDYMSVNVNQAWLANSEPFHIDSMNHCYQAQALGALWNQ